MVARRTTTNRWRITRQRKARGHPPCHICHEAIDYTDRNRGPLSYELDHVIEVADGGTDHDSNLAPAHRQCHLKKTAENTRKRAENAPKRRGQAPAVPSMLPGDERHMRDW